MIDPKQLRDYVVRPVLARLGLPGGIGAEKLVMGTAAQESGLKYLHQVVGGPALGLWQMEPATFRDLFNRWLKTKGRAEIFMVAHGLTLEDHGGDFAGQLAGNLYLGAAMCRILYYSRPGEIPENATVEQLAGLWKKCYNTSAGKGTPEQFIRNYERIIAPIYKGE